jgi:hypothetical protein
MTTSIRMTIAALIFGAVASGPTAAQGVAAPVVQSGDSWTYRQTAETKAGFKEERQVYTVTRTTPTTLYLDVRQDGSAQAPRSVFSGNDWRRVRSVNGKETVVNQPFDFPLNDGKSWNTHYREDHPNAGHAWEDIATTSTATGHETVQVGAGRFDTIKIEVEGKWTALVVATSNVATTSQAASGGAAIDSRVGTTAAHEAEGRIYRAYWYAPTVKRWVKSIEEYYSSNGERTERTTAELEAYSVR